MAEGEDQYQLLDRVAAYCRGASLEENFERFAAEHAGPFMELAKEGGWGDGSRVEHNLEFTKVYDEFKDHFERTLNKCIAEVGGDEVEFQDQASRAIDQLPRDSPRRFFVEALLAVAEYERFFVLMMNEAQRLVREGESKER